MQIRLYDSNSRVYVSFEPATDEDGKLTGYTRIEILSDEGKSRGAVVKTEELKKGLDLVL